MAVPRLMIVLLGATALVVAAIVLLATGAWWALGVVLAVHALAAATVIAYALLRASDTGDKPDPVTEARMEEDEEEPPRRPARRVRDREVFN